ncbi:CoA pyrophosphatase [Hyphomicrobium methylovorum]|uniref:CoA pyrophosphatase n=1 Tax=Hyphomicrobium methylovorum TaxID=84 RepID=UPI0015E63287|nr:CoA pyrophosphatase [Hyphomicrobium methylovorum]MBA2126910.1 CoA pyrophosphatase [Hyphomicrobium methylovorum]
MSPLSASNVAIELDAANFARLARSRLLNIPPDLHDAQGPGDDDLNPGANRYAATPRHAAVLVPVVARDPLTVILTERTAHLSAHAGQIAFPGGKVETFDETPFAAAAREAREEVALGSEFLDLLGYLPAYRTGTGYIVTPAVALVRPGFTLEAEPTEVARVFEVPLAFLMNEANHRIESRLWSSGERRFYAMPYGEHYIWGATAGIIRSLYRRLVSA